MKKTISIFLLLCIVIPLFGQSVEGEPLRERLYLQTDKPLYLAGEFLWLKIISTDTEGKPITLSKVGYVELLDEATSRIQAKIEIKSGVGEGSLLLPVDLPTGNYRLVAYTQYMQNEGENVYFNKIIPIVNTFMIDRTVPMIADSSDLPRTAPSMINTIGITIDKQRYPSRSQGEIRLNNLPEALHTLSVSIAGNESIPVTNDISINQWKKQLSSIEKPHFKGGIIAEYEGHILKGKLINITTGIVSAVDRPIPLLGFVGDQVRVFGGQQDADGNVAFYTKRISGMHEAATVALSSSMNEYRIDIQSPFITHSEKKLPPLELNTFWNDLLLKRSVGLQVLHNYMTDSLQQLSTVDALFQWEPDWRYKLDEYTRFNTMEEIVVEFVTGLRFRRIDGRRVLSVLTEERVGFTRDNSLVILDGIPIFDHELIFRYDPMLIEEIDVYKGKFLFTNQLYDGIAVFKTYNNNYPGLTLPSNTQLFNYEGTQPHRYFYAPSYQTEEQKISRMPDYRHTLLWEPEVKVNGQSYISIPFTTSDMKGDFMITVEGLTKTGEPVYATSFFIVD